MIKTAFNLFKKSFLNKSFSTTTSIQPLVKYSEKVSKARNVFELYDLQPNAVNQFFVAPNATVLGEVYVGTRVAVWHGTVIRGDINAIKLVSNISIGQNCVLFTAGNLPNGLPAELIIRNNVVIQAGCTLYSCTISNNVFIGYNSVIMEGAIIEQGAIIAPNSVVPPGRIVPAKQMWGGNPIKFVREVYDREIHVNRTQASDLWQRTYDYTYQFLPYGNAYLLKENDAQYDITFYDEQDYSHNTLQKNYDPNRLY